MSLYGRRKIGTTELANTAFATAVRLGLSEEDTWKLAGESLVTHARLSKVEKSKSSHRLSHQRKKAALAAGAERTEYIESTSGRRHFAYPPCYEFEQVFFRLSLPYEINQEEKNPGAVSLTRLRYRFIKHLVHAGIRGKSAALAVGIGTLLYRCGIAEVREIYVERAKTAYASWQLSAVVQGEENEDSDFEKSDRTAALRVAKDGMLYEILERFRHLTSPLLHPDSLSNARRFVDLLKTQTDDAAAALAARVVAQDRYVLDEFDSQPGQIERLLTAINATLESEQLFAESAFKKVVGKRKTPLAAPSQSLACRNRAAIEKAWPSQVQKQPLALQKIKEGREVRTEYLENPDGRMITKAREFLGSLAPWGLICRANVLEPLFGRLRHLLNRTADPKGEAETDIHHAFIHPDCFGQLVEWFLTRKPEILLPRFFHASASDADEKSPEDGGSGDVMSDEFQSPPRMTGEQRSRLKAFLGLELKRGDEAAPESLIVTVDGVEQDLTRFGSDSPGEKTYAFETSGSSELVQVWTAREDGRTLLTACLLREESGRSRTNLKNATLAFDIDYNGDYKITITHLLKSPVRKSEKVTAIPPLKLGLAWRPSHVLVIIMALTIVVGLTSLIWWRGGSVTVVTTNGTSSPSISPGPTSTSEVAVSSTPTPDLTRTLTDGGGQLTVDQNGNLAGPTIDVLPDHLKQQVQTAWRDGRLTTPDLSGLEGAEIKTMGSDSNELQFRLRSPVRQVVRSQRPIFSWNALAKTDSYTVTISDADTYDVVDSGEPVETNHWRPKRRLARGHYYVWQVKALANGKEIIMPTLGQHEAKFKVLDSSLEDGLRRAESASPRSHLALGVLYARAGLYRDAQRELRSFVNANPDSKVAAKLLNVVNHRLRAN